MNTIYTPKGPAREYSPDALNLYDSCDHGCIYCYVNNIPGFFGKNKAGNIPTPRKDILLELEKHLKKHGAPKEQILLSFTGDPFCSAEKTHRITKQALALLQAAGAKVAILTKGGFRAFDALEEIQKFGHDIKVGATLTFSDPAKSKEVEPGAALPEERLLMLKGMHQEGVKTWVSIEPVMIPRQSLDMIQRSLEWVDHYKVGKLNHVKNTTDWPRFLFEAVKILRAAGKPFYVKEDLRAFEQQAGVTLTAEERDMNFLCLK